MISLSSRSNLSDGTFKMAPPPLNALRVLVPLINEHSDFDYYNYGAGKICGACSSQGPAVVVPAKLV